MADVLRLAIPILRVASIARAAGFYCDQLGFEQRFVYRPDPARPDPCYMGLACDQAWHVPSFPGDAVAGAAVVLLVDRVDRLRERLKRDKVAVDLEPTDQTWGNREMHVRDPDGNDLRFIQQGQG
jgi:catechol 2,3-dioxygenase-like lactoylglutathione lyase family enzyme